ncbi:carbonic anhydrase [Brevibacterium sp. UBA7493]|uniref:carbonic anhydrase n=1 Tax=Brevibacterium sp. UBA7493 TaxID=1946121 RepID=UPI00257964DC|nr:carbonic anhydrase [Brevibacterium sp. UBA7493]
MPESEYNSPAAAFLRLMDGNERFVAGTPQHPNQDAVRREDLKTAQAPFATLFGCSDSRVAAEMIFDVGLGDMFVVRTAGQVTDSVTLGSLEYGVEVLGTPLLVVLGHDNCGAITATIESFDSGQTPDGFISDVVARLLPAVVHARAAGRTDVNSTVAQNTVDTVKRLYQRSTILRTAVEEGRLVMLGLTYHLADGRVKVVSRMGSHPPRIPRADPAHASNQ